MAEALEASRRTAPGRPPDQLAQERGERSSPATEAVSRPSGTSPNSLRSSSRTARSTNAAAGFIEATDWIVWQLTGVEAAAAAPSAIRRSGHPTRACPRRTTSKPQPPVSRGSTAKLGSDFCAPRHLCRRDPIADLAERLGLASRRSGRGRQRRLVRVGSRRRGRATGDARDRRRNLDLRHGRAPEEILVPGITGVVRDGILPGLYGYEAGSPPSATCSAGTSAPARRRARRARGAHDALEREAGDGSARAPPAW